MRFLGSQGEKEEAKGCGIEAAVSIGNPFDCLATGLQLKYTFYGIYDRVLKQSLSRPFISKRFKKLTKLTDEEI